MEEKRTPDEIALQNLINLENFFYPGRFIIAGMNKNGSHLIQMYGITGRSEETQNRVITDFGNGLLKTEFADASKNTGNPDLLLYNVMEENDGCYAVSNGKQTTDARICGMTSNGLANPYGLTNPRFVNNWSYEKDSNNTSRITAITLLPKKGKPSLEMSILKKSPINDDCDQLNFRFGSFGPGIGRFISTYGNEKGDPLPSYNGDPMLMSLHGDIGSLTQRYWDALQSPRLISLAVKFINIETGQSSVEIRNVYKKVA